MINEGSQADCSRRAVLYDLDGTVVNTQKVIRTSLRYSTRHVLHTMIDDRRLMAKVGQPTEVEMRDFSQDEHQLTRLVEDFRWCNTLVHDVFISGYPGMEKLLGAVRELGMPQAIVTSKRRAGAQRSLRALGLEGWFELLVCADDVTRPKPHPQPLEKAARQLGVDVRRCLYVGDSPFDIQAGRAAGMATVGITWGMFPEEVAAEKPSKVVDTPLELAGFIREWVAR